RGPGARTQCQNNLRQLILAFHSSPSTGRSDTFDTGALPPGCIGRGAIPEERLSWMVALLPNLEQDPLYRRIDLEKGYAGNLPTVEARIVTFVCPASKEPAPAPAVTHYVALSGIGRDAARQPAGARRDRFLGYDRLTSLSMIKDGTSNTIALMETRVGLGPWARGGFSTVRGFEPADLPLHGDDRPFGGHPEGMNAAMADASVRLIRSSIDPMKLSAAITIAGGESVDLD